MSETKSVIKRVLNAAGRMVSRLNLNMINLIFINVIGWFSVYKLIAAKMTNIAVAIAIADLVYTIINIIIIVIKRRTAVKKISELGLGEKDDMNYVSGFIRDFSLPTFFSVIKNSVLVMPAPTAASVTARSGERSSSQLTLAIRL